MVLLVKNIWFIVPVHASHDGKLQFDLCVRIYGFVNWSLFLLHCCCSSTFVSKPHNRGDTTSLPEVWRGDFANSLVWRVQLPDGGHFHQTKDSSKRKDARKSDHKRSHQHDKYLQTTQTFQKTTNCVDWRRAWYGEDHLLPKTGIWLGMQTMSQMGQVFSKKHGAALPQMPWDQILSLGRY